MSACHATLADIKTEESSDESNDEGEEEAAHSDQNSDEDDMKDFIVDDDNAKGGGIGCAHLPCSTSLPACGLSWITSQC
jgi:hypothetical protein